MDLHKQLKLIGLNNSEIVVYLYLLENGLSTPPIVSRETKIARTNCYNLLEDLKNKGLIKEQAFGKRKAYVANDPTSLLLSIEQKRTEIQQILPYLQGIYTVQKNKPKVKFYDGLEQVKQIYSDSLNSKKIFSLQSSKKLFIDMPEFYNYYLTEVKKRKINFYQLAPHSFVSGDPAKNPDALGEFFRAHFLPNLYDNIPTNILIWADTVALIAWNEPFFATTLTNTLLAQTFQTMFDIMWNATI